MGILSSAALMAGPFLGLVAITVLIASRLVQQWFGCAVLQGRHYGVPLEPSEAHAPKRGLGPFSET